MLRYLCPDGTLTAKGLSFLTDVFNKGLLTAETFLDMYHRFVLARYFYYDFNRESETDRMVLSIGAEGQEAGQIVSAYLLEPRDSLLLYARSHTTAFAKLGYKEDGTLVRGINPKTIFLSFYAYGGAPPEVITEFRRHGIFPFYTSVGVHLLHAVGVAWAYKQRGEKRIAAAYFGDGATSEGDFHSALNWAMVLRVPVIFFCENNQYAITTPLRRQTATETLIQKAQGHGMPVERIDGNDPFAVFDAMHNAIQRARDGWCPTFIESITYRLCPHTNAVRDVVKVDPEERREAERCDPMKRWRAFLVSPAAKKFGIHQNQKYTI